MSNLIASLWRAQTFACLAFHLSWFLFGFSPCWFLVLVVIFITRPSSSETVLVWKTRFRCGNITGSTLRKVPHLHMCGDFALFMVCNISNGVGLKSFGVYLQKISQFWCFCSFSKGRKCPDLARRFPTRKIFAKS